LLPKKKKNGSMRDETWGTPSGSSSNQRHKKGADKERGMERRSSEKAAQGGSGKLALEGKVGTYPKPGLVGGGGSRGSMWQKLLTST